MKAPKDLFKAVVLNEFHIRRSYNARKFYSRHSLIQRTFLRLGEMVHSKPRRHTGPQDLSALRILCKHDNRPKGVCYKAAIDLSVHLGVNCALHFTCADQQKTTVSEKQYGLELPPQKCNGRGVWKYIKTC